MNRNRIKDQLLRLRQKAIIVQSFTFRRWLVESYFIQSQMEERFESDLLQNDQYQKEGEQSSLQHLTGTTAMSKQIECHLLLINGSNQGLTAIFFIQAYLDPSGFQAQAMSSLLSTQQQMILQSYTQYSIKFMKEEAVIRDIQLPLLLSKIVQLFDEYQAQQMMQLNRQHIEHIFHQAARDLFQSNIIGSKMTVPHERFAQVQRLINEVYKLRTFSLRSEEGSLEAKGILSRMYYFLFDHYEMDIDAQRQGKQVQAAIDENSSSRMQWERLKSQQKIVRNIEEDCCDIQLKKILEQRQKESKIQKMEQKMQSLSQKLAPFQQNWQEHYQLSHEDKQKIAQISRLHVSQLSYQVFVDFSEKELQDIVKLVDEAVLQRQIDNSNRDQFGLSAINIQLAQLCQQRLKKVLIPQPKKEEKYHYLVALFYQSCKDIYSPYAKQFIMDVLTVIQKKVDCAVDKQLYLKGFLRQCEMKDLKVSDLAQKLNRHQKLQPLHGQIDEETIKKYQSLKEQVQNIESQFQKAVRALFARRQENQKFPQFKMLSLNSGVKRKTVTITINGFLSQDTNVNQYWSFFVDALRQSEVYSISWKSSTIQELKKSIAKFAGKTLLSSLQPYSLLALFGIGSQIYSVAKQNPFNDACKQAKRVGSYLADLLIEHFSDRFINLVGFSLGTEVILSCISRLVKLGHEKLINRILTIGGVAEKAEVKNLLERCKRSINWLNLWSSKDYVVRHLFKIASPNANPIGASDIDAIDGHIIRSVDIGSEVSGHMDFKNKLFAIGKMSGMGHD